MDGISGLIDDSTNPLIMLSDITIDSSLNSNFVGSGASSFITSGENSLISSEREAAVDSIELNSSSRLRLLFIPSLLWKLIIPNTESVFIF